MWVMTSIGFYSVIMKNGTDYLTVRARVAADLDSLRTQYMPGLSKTISYAGSDYPFRATIAREDYALGLKKLVMDIDYDNFKNEVAKKQGHERADVYADVWVDLLRLETVEEKMV